AIARWTANPIAGLVWGFLAGAVVQSGRVVAFILVSMLASGLVVVRRALPIILGANVGGTLLVVISSLDIHLFVLVVLGLAGLTFTNERFLPVRPVALCAFGVGLIFLGLHTLQIATEPLAAEPWAKATIAGAGGSFLLMFAAAAVL